MLTGTLRGDYNLKAAINGKGALKLAKNVRPDLILLDIMMPEIDGYEVCERLKADYATRHIPIIFITAKTQQADELRGFELGAVDYITKPFSPPIVKARVRTQIALSDQNRELDRKVKVATESRNKTRM